MSAGRTILRADLAEALRPYSNARINRERASPNPWSGPKPRKGGVDIMAGSSKIDADVRDILADGVEVFFYSGCEVVRWEDIRELHVRHFDDDERTVGKTRLVVVDAIAEAA